MTPRLAAVAVLSRVIGDGVSLAEALPPVASRIAKPQDRAFLQELCYGALRWHFRLDAALGMLLERPLKARDLDLGCVLRLALYEIAFLRTPDYAAVNEAVSLVRALHKGRAGGLANAVLRRFLRERAAIEARLDADFATRHALPAWLCAHLAVWGDDCERIAVALNGRPPMTLRVNRRHGTREDYLRRLAEAGIEATPHDIAPDGVTLAAPCDVADLPGFADGLVSVQDAAAQLAAILLDCRPGQRVLDACCAPGGKTAHLLESANGGLDLLAIDIDEARLSRVRENLDRLRLDCRLLAADASRPGEWYDGRPFDRILIDAPCSATGVIRRHPDIKLLRCESDIPALAARQGELLAALWPLLAPGGMLVYATCSLLPEENENVAARFLARTPGAAAVSLPETWGIARGPGRQILTGEHGMDGFYYARFARQ